ncbi:MAG: anti-repressor SinI family protein [Bacillota bacterium]
MASDLDLEWVDLILKAKEIGLTEEEIRDFFVESKIREILVSN